MIDVERLLAAYHARRLDYLWEGPRCQAGHVVAGSNLMVSRGRKRCKACHRRYVRECCARRAEEKRR